MNVVEIVWVDLIVKTAVKVEIATYLHIYCQF